MIDVGVMSQLLLQSLPFGNTLIGEIILFAIIAIVLVIVFTLGKTILKILFGIIANSILGIIAIFLLNQFVFGSLNGIPISWATMIPTAIFGLPAVGTFVLLKFFGIPL